MGKIIRLMTRLGIMKYSFIKIFLRSSLLRRCDFKCSDVCLDTDASIARPPRIKSVWRGSSATLHLVRLPLSDLRHYPF
jgi:hypothetical protein